MVAMDLLDFTIAHFHGHIRLFRFFYTADKYDQTSSLCHAVNIAANAVVQRPSLGNKVVDSLRADDLQFLIGKRRFSRKACVGYAERLVFLRIVDFLDALCFSVVRNRAVFGNSTDFSFMS